MKSKNLNAYLKLDRRKYAGEYVVLVNGKLVNHGPNLEEMVDEVRRKNPGVTPFVTKVFPPQDALILKE